MTKRQNEALNNQRKLVEETEKMQEEIGTKEYDFFIPMHGKIKKP